MHLPFTTIALSVLAGIALAICAGLYLAARDSRSSNGSRPPVGEVGQPVRDETRRLSTVLSSDIQRSGAPRPSMRGASGGRLLVEKRLRSDDGGHATVSGALPFSIHCGSGCSHG